MRCIGLQHSNDEYFAGLHWITFNASFQQSSKETDRYWRQVCLWVVDVYALLKVRRAFSLALIGRAVRGSGGSARRAGSRARAAQCALPTGRHERRHGICGRWDDNPPPPRPTKTKENNIAREAEGKLRTPLFSRGVSRTIRQRPTQPGE